VPTSVNRDAWPVHVTIASNFVVDVSEATAVSSLLESCALDLTAFAVRLGPTAFFGVNADLPVLLAPHQSFDRLHTALGTGLSRLSGFVATEPDYWFEGYRPHASLGSAVRVEEGDLLPIRTLTLVSQRGRTGTLISAINLL
jgi:2'-5' RNA ligase